jgi:uncharacterized membrane protein
LGALVLLPFLWSTERLLPLGLPLHVSGSCLLVLMFGWPLAMWTLVAVAVAAGFMPAGAPPDAGRLAAHLLWLGLLPGTLALALGLMVRRWLPAHLFVFILGRAFIVSALAVSLAGLLGWWAGRKPDSIGAQEWLLACWLLGWGEAIATGMLTAIFVAFKPQWMLTWSDQRYLPGPPHPPLD